MDNLKKALAEQKKAYKDLLANLDICYSECGEAVFKCRQETANDTAAYHANDYFETWQSAREDRDKNTQTIIAIKTAVTRQNELKKFISEVDKLLYEDIANRKKVASEFNILFFHTYYDVYPHYFIDISKDIEPLKAQIKNFEHERAELEAQKNTANFLQKISLTTQLTVLKAKYTAAQKKLEKSVTLLSEALLQNSQVIDLYANRQLHDSLIPLYEQFYEYTARMAEAENRKAALIEENSAIEAELVSCGASDNPQNRITELTNYIKELDKTINTAEKEQGLYAFQICYPDADAPSAAVIPNEKNIQTYLETIREQSVQLKQQHCTITILENDLAINEEIKRIENLNKAIVQYERRISDYQQMIQKAQSDIARAEDKKLHLQSANEELKSQVS